MFRYFAENITFVLIKNKILNIKNRNIYVYAIEVILLNVILLLSLLGISILGKDLSCFMGFLLFFVPLRTFVGGYHAKHSEVCFGMSIGIYMVVMIIFYNYPNLYKNIIVVSIYILAIITFLIWSPLKNENHILTNYQYKRNRKILFGSIVINIIIFVFLSKMNYTIASYEIIFTVLASIFLIIGKLELYQNKKE